MDLHPDFRDLLAEFDRCEVEFAILGGYAVGYHAKPRATKDLDLLVSASPENLERVAQALAAFGAPTHVVQAARTMQRTDVCATAGPSRRGASRAACLAFAAQLSRKPTTGRTDREVSG